MQQAGRGLAREYRTKKYEVSSDELRIITMTVKQQQKQLNDEIGKAFGRAEEDYKFALARIKVLEESFKQLQDTMTSDLQEVKSF